MSITSRDSNGVSMFTGVFSVPSLKTGHNDVIPARDFMASGLTRQEVMEDLYKQCARYWEVVPRFTELQVEMLRLGESAITVGTLSQTAVALHDGKIGRPKSDSRTECSHEVTLAITQMLAQKTQTFDNTLFCVKQSSKVCSFTLITGTSDIQRYVQLGLITVATKYQHPGAVSPHRVFGCNQMAAAMPYLMNGYAATGHRDM